MRGSSLTTRKAGARLLGRIHGGSWADRRYGGEVEKKELAGAGRRQMGAGDGWIRPSGAKFLQVETGLVLRANAHLGRLRRLIAAVGVMNSDHGDSHALQRPELAEGHSTSSTSCLPHALLHPRPLLRTYATPSSSSSSMLHATSSLHPEGMKLTLPLCTRGWPWTSCPIGLVTSLPLVSLQDIAIFVER
ncbi:hypothetical protein VPH35_026391 [Triticum aestivum]